MRQLFICLLTIYVVILASGLRGQETVTDTTNSNNQGSLSDTSSNNNMDYDRMDSLLIKVDSIINQSYGIKEQTNEKGQRLQTAVGLKLSSLGIGLELTLAFNPKFSLRFSGSFYQLNTAVSNADAEIAFSQFTGGTYLVADYQFVKFMHATVGILYAVNVEEGAARSTEGLTVGGIEIPAQIVGEIAYAIEQNSIGYYAGVGFGRTISFERRVAFSLSLGGYYIPKEPTVSVEASGMLSPTDNESTRNQISENNGFQKLYPFISIQVSYRL